MDPFNLIHTIITSVLIPILSYALHQILSQQNQISKLETKIEFHKEQLNYLAAKIDEINRNL